MPRRGRAKILRVRYKNGEAIRSRLYVNRNPRTAPGRILRVNKVSQEELFHIGAYNQLPEQLMKEFRKGGDKKSIDLKLAQVGKELQLQNLEREVEIA